MIREQCYNKIREMAYQEKELTKLYYTIGEVSEMLGTNASQLRFWEGEFNNLKLRKNKKGDRLFTVEDIETLRLIQYLLKEKGFTIEGAKNQLKNNTHESANHLKVIESLKKLRHFLVDLKNEL